MLVVVVWLWLGAVVDAQKVGLKSHLGFSCFNAALTWNFSCPAVYLPYDCRCANNDFLATALGCVNDYASGINEVVKGYDYIRSQCHYWGSRSLSNTELDRIYKENKDRYISAESIIDQEVTKSPVKVPFELFRDQLSAAKDTKFHYKLGTDFGLGIIGYWSAIMSLAAVSNAVRIVSPGCYNLIGDRTVVAFQKYVSLPALAGKRHHDPFRVLRFVRIHAPTRGQALIIIGFCALNIASIVSLLFTGSISPLAFESKQDMILHQVANRSGILAIMHVPILVLFACRNNPLIIITSWPYDTFMTFHRWCARWMAVHGIIHGVALTWSSLKEHVVIYKWTQVHNWRGGNLAAYAMIIMIVIALRPIRSRVYEFFKLSHQLLFLMFLICLIVHLSDYGWLGYIWVTVIFYGLEYSLRIARIIAFGGIQVADMELSEGGMYRLTVHGKRKWYIHPGAYVYVTFLHRNLWWQSHPFSAFQPASSKTQNSLSCVCKAVTGSTKTMSSLLEGTGSCKMKVLVEGPYGSANYVYDHDSVLLLAGGVGFTAMYSFASMIVESLTPGQSLSVIWVVKNCDNLRAFEHEILHLHSKGHLIDFRIYITQGATTPTESVADFNGGVTTMKYESRNQSTSTLVPNSAPSGKPVVSNVDLTDTDVEQLMCNPGPSSCNDLELLITCSDNISVGRPNIKEEVTSFITASRGTQAICSCGPPKFCDAIRDSIVSSIMMAPNKVDYFEEAFSW